MEREAHEAKEGEFYEFQDWQELPAHPLLLACRVCRCTDYDCEGCIERTGDACWWVEPDLCSACESTIETPPEGEGR